MNIGTRQSHRVSGAFARNPAFVATLLVILTGVIILGVHFIIDRAIFYAVEGHAQASALEWTEKFNANLSNENTALSEGEISSDQRQVIDAAAAHGNAYAFIVYDPDGRAIYSSDYGVIDTEAVTTVNQDALAVVASGEPNMTVIQKTSHSGNLNVFVDAMVPAKRPDGMVVGAIQLYLDRSDTSSLYKSFLDWIGWVLPAVCAVVYAVPAAAFVFMRERAFAKQEHVNHLSKYDTLTGALNRRSLNVECEKLFASRTPDSRIGILFIDVDKFKSVNDLYGHEFGDVYLQNVSERLKECVTEEDWVARIGGDEFVVVCHEATASQLETLAVKILDKSREPFKHKGTTVQGSLSIGTRLVEPSDTVKDAFHAADLALYQAKANGRNQVQAYFPALDAAMMRRCTIEKRLRQALENDDFDVNYQQLTNPDDRSVIGFEALLRLNDESGAPISPEEFIPVAEEAGIIHELGIKTLRRAIEVAKTWPEHVYLSVNLSPAQFQSGDLDTQVAAVLSDLDFDASRLELEVTESLLMSNEESVSSQLLGFKQQGISIAMDDFGTGYSSLGYLWKYNFDKLKIDRVFLEGLEFDGDRYGGIIETIVMLGNKMGMQVTVEGVENKTHTDLLDGLPCDQYQGFLFGRPLPAEETLNLFSPQHRLITRTSTAAPSIRPGKSTG